MEGLKDPTESNEAHLLNKYDQRADFPEYEPYFYRSNDTAPLQKWIADDNGGLEKDSPF